MSTVAQTNVATSTKVVQVRGVSKVFKRDAFQVTALDDVSIDIAKGEFLALMGPSGSGKTTLLNMIAAIDRPTSGELLVQGQDIFRFNDAQIARWRNEHIGYVFQTFNLIPVLTAFENVELPLLLTKLTSQQRRDHVLTALKLVGIGRPRRSPAQAALRRTGTARGHCARHRQRSDFATRRRAYRRSGQPFRDGGIGNSEATERGFSENDCDGHTRSARRVVRARYAALGKRHAPAARVGRELLIVD